MQDREMWLVINSESRLICMPLSDVLSIYRQDECVIVAPRNTDESDDIILDASEGEGIVYKGTFTNCFDYINKKENLK